MSYYAVPQSTKPLTLSLTNTVASNIGGGAYANLSSNTASATLTGTAVPITRAYTVTIPSISGDTSLSEPKTTNEINITFAGVMPFTYLNAVGAKKAPINPNSNDPYATQQTAQIISALSSYFGQSL